MYKTQEIVRFDIRMAEVSCELTALKSNVSDLVGCGGRTFVPSSQPAQDCGYRRQGRETDHAFFFLPDSVASDHLGSR